MATGDQPGLRARKKARTRTEIQRAAFALFRRHGYTATTMTQVADAADVSPSTLFRYFPTKESLVTFDALDLPILRAFAAQPPTLALVPALRAAVRGVLGPLPASQRADVVERLRLMLALPPVRVALFDQAAGPIGQLAAVLAERTGRPADDFETVIQMGTMAGTVLAALAYAAAHPDADVVELVDAALARLEMGERDPG